MVDVTVSELEADQLKKAGGPVRVRGPAGETLGVFTPARPLDDLDRQILAKVRQQRGSFGETFTTQQVLEHLKQLESGACPGE